MVKIVVNDEDGQEVVTFEGNTEESIGMQAQEEGAPVPISCGSGACRTCVMKVVEGMEHLDKEAVGPAMIEIEDDEILSCICGVKQGCCKDAKIVVNVENL